MKPEWQVILDEVEQRDPVLPDEPRGIMDVVAYASDLRAKLQAAEAECDALVAQRDALPQTEMALRTEVARLEAEVARLRNDLLAYGHHLESCKMLCLAKTDGWKYAKLHGCSCGFDTAKENK